MTGVDAEETTLYLLRHGATEANERVPYILQGSGIDLPLSVRGVRQAEAVARFLSRRSVDAVYSSTMFRARQTAEAIAIATGTEAVAIEALHECHVGAWEGMDWESIRREFPDAHRRFQEDPATHPYLEGESYGDVHRRAWPVIDRLLSQHPGQRIVVVAHNVVNRVVAAHLLGLELRRAQSLRQANCCINVIRRHGGRTELVTYNSTLYE
jgi:broad specificity phosphatase PhoE